MVVVKDVVGSPLSSSCDRVRDPGGKMGSLISVLGCENTCVCVCVCVCMCVCVRERGREGEYGILSHFPPFCHQKDKKSKGNNGL